MFTRKLKINSMQNTSLKFQIEFEKQKSKQAERKAVLETFIGKCQTQKEKDMLMEGYLEGKDPETFYNDHLKPSKFTIREERFAQCPSCKKSILPFGFNQLSQNHLFHCWFCSQNFEAKL